MTARARKEKPPPYRDALTFTLLDAATLSGLSVATFRRRAAEEPAWRFVCPVCLSPRVELVDLAVVA